MQDRTFPQEKRGFSLTEKAIRRSLSEQVYSYILEKIRLGVLKSSDRINIEEIAAQFGVSRTPVREAVGMLTRDGFVEQNYLSGPRVAEFNKTIVTDSIDTLNFLYNGLLPLVVEKGDVPALVKKLDKALSLQRGAFQAKDREKFMEYSVLFHEEIIQACPNKRLAQLTGQVQRQMDVWVAAYQDGPQAMEHSLRQHEELLQLLRNGDCEAFLEVFHRHNAEPLQFFRRQA